MHCHRRRLQYMYHVVSSSNNLVGMGLDTRSIHQEAACPFKDSIVVVSIMHKKALPLAWVYGHMHLDTLRCGKGTLKACGLLQALCNKMGR